MVLISHVSAVLGAIDHNVRYDDFVLLRGFQKRSCQAAFNDEWAVVGEEYRVHRAKRTAHDRVAPPRKVGADIEFQR